MTSAELTTTRNPSKPAARIVEMLKGAYRAYWDWRSRKATIEILRSLDGRTLRDIGLHLDEIDSVVYGKRGDRKQRYDANWRRRPGK
jgi:uncharacterized protein YjiS (DUF1127 family)